MTPWTAAHQASLSFTIFQSLLRLISIKSMMPSIHLIFCLPLLLTPSIFPNIRVFSNESALHIRWPKYWSFSISPSSEYCNKRYVDVVSVLKYLNTLKVFLTLSKHSPHTVAVAFAACGVTPELTQISSSSFFTIAQEDSFLP